MSQRFQLDRLQLINQSMLLLLLLLFLIHSCGRGRDGREEDLINQVTKRNELRIERYGHVSQHVQPFEVLVQYDQMTRLDIVECESRNVLMIAIVEHEGESVVGPVLNLFTVRYGIDQGDRCGGEVLWKKNGLLLLFHHFLLLLFVMMTTITTTVMLLLMLLFLNLLKVVMVEGGNGGEGGQC